MEAIQVAEKDGVYYADIDVSVNEWKVMLQDADIFNEASIDMLKSGTKNLNIRLPINTS